MRIKSTKMKLALTLVAAGCISLAAATVWGQATGTDCDQRLVNAMDQSGLEYRIDEDNDVQIILAWDDERTHAIWASTETETYGGIEVREVWAFVTEYDSVSDIPNEVLLDLLRANAKLKFGKYAIAVNENTGLVRVLFVVTVSPELDGPSLATMIKFVGEVADEMEKVLETVPGIDTF